MAVIASATGAAVFGLTGVAAGLAGGALLGAGAGALYSGITKDGDILNSALTGGLIGGAVGGLGAAFGPGLMGGTAAPIAGSTAAASTPALSAASLTSANVAELNALAAANGVVPEMAASLPGAGLLEAPSVIPPGAADVLGKTAPLTKGEILGYGLAGSAAMSLLGNMNQKKLSAPPVNPGQIRPYTYGVKQNKSAYPTGPQYGSNGLPNIPTQEQNYFDQSFTAGTPYKAAAGGLMAAGGPIERMSQNMMGGQDNMYPQSQQEHTNFATPTQMPTSAEVIRSDYDTKTNPYTGVMMAGGGKAEEDDETSTERSKRLKNMNRMLKDAQFNVPDIEYISDAYSPRSEPSRLNLNAIPQTFVENPQMKGVMGRAGANYALDRDTNLSAGVSGFAGKDRGIMTVKPSTMDVGISRKLGPGYLSGQYQRSLTGQEPARYMANYAINMADGGIAYDAATQTYTGLPSINNSGDTTALSPDLIAQLTPQYQAANPNAFSYDAKNQRYGAVNPTMSQLNAYKAEQDRIAQEAVMSSYDYANGGDVQSYNLGDYSDGGRLLKGPGDGVSDDIPAVIGNKQPARLADGEFVIPARIVSELGNGSTDAGAKRLYAMMDKIQSGRRKTVGKGKVAVNTKAAKYLPA